jgi:hypothetical protein
MSIRWWRLFSAIYWGKEVITTRVLLAAGLIVGSVALVSGRKT